MSESIPTFTLISKTEIGPRRGEPLSIGIPVSRGSFTEQQQLQLLDQNNNSIPCDIRVLDRWPDHSARWVFLSFRAYTENSQTTYHVNFSPQPEKQAQKAADPEIRIEPEAEGFAVNTGPVSFSLGPGDGWPVRRVFDTRGSDWLSKTSNGLQITLGDGKPVPVKVTEMSIETAGAVRAVVKGVGTASMGSRRRLEIEWRIEFFAGLSVVVFHVIIRNPHRARHSSGYWELGDPGSTLLRDVSFKIQPKMAPAKRNAYWSAEIGSPICLVTVPFEIYQDSSGGENWQSANHVNREGKMPLQFRGYRCSQADLPSGHRASPIAAIETICGDLVLGSRHFWQNFPKAVELSNSGITYGLFPRQSGQLFELQGGEQKTHSFALSFGRDAITDIPLDWFRQPLIPSINPEWTSQTEAIDYLTPSCQDPHKGYLDLVNLAIEGEDSFTAKREKVDEYGWRSFGDIYADHETVFAHEPPTAGPLVSHYNNQYDPIAGFCYQWLRSGNPLWWEHFCELAGHVVDIDIYHTNEDKAAYNNGLFWHTYHYVDAGRSTHRSYPHSGPSNGGGPSNEHVYTTGLILHYFMTGCTASRDTAIGLAQFIIDIDDGSKTYFRWFAKGYTGLASASRNFDYHGPGRGSGNALNALLDGHRLTGDRKFLDKGEQLIRRVSHPEEEIVRHNLLDAENRWFYTIYLQALGKYLDYKMSLDQLDDMYAYSREALLHYARWMAANEYPYLEKPEVLEYPTETWAAQDMRKSEVFKYASLHADQIEKQAFGERAGYFFENATRTLHSMKTKSLCRPIVILISFGWMQAWFDRHPDAGRPLPRKQEANWSAQMKFTPQKTIALRRLKYLLLLTALVFIAGLVVVISNAVGIAAR
jgi:hypothetical protein